MPDRLITARMTGALPPARPDLFSRLKRISTPVVPTFSEDRQDHRTGGPDVSLIEGLARPFTAPKR